MRLIPMRTIFVSESKETCLGPVFWPFTNSDQYFSDTLMSYSREKKVFKMYTKYLLTFLSDCIVSVLESDMHTFQTCKILAYSYPF